jgi:RimJ/RimL family protein N-acetyltransferase
LVELTTVRDEDSDTLFRWINDRELVVLSSAFHPVTRAAHDAWFARAQSSDEVAFFAIRTFDLNEFIGSCQLHTIDRTHRSAELQIRIGSRAHWSHGFGTEAVRLLLDVGFTDLSLHRVYLHVLADNERAQRAYLRAGFRREGVLRDAAFVDGRYQDLIVMGILDGERTSA